MQTSTQHIFLHTERVALYMYNYTHVHTSDGRVSSTRMLGPEESGPNAQIDRAARRSQSYFVWKNSPIFFLLHEICTVPCSMSSASPFSRGSDIMVSLFLRGGGVGHMIDHVTSHVTSCDPLFVGSFGKAFEGGGFHDCLTEGDDRI